MVATNPGHRTPLQDVGFILISKDNLYGRALKSEIIAQINSKKSLYNKGLNVE